MWYQKIPLGDSLPNSRPKLPTVLFSGNQPQPPLGGFTAGTNSAPMGGGSDTPELAQMRAIAEAHNQAVEAKAQADKALAQQLEDAKPVADGGKSKQGKACFGNPMQINDPFRQFIGYDANSSNQPAMNNLREAFEYQYKHGNKSTLSSSMFTPSQENFTLRHIERVDPQMYSELMSGDKPCWHAQSNSKRFRELFPYNNGNNNNPTN